MEYLSLLQSNLLFSNFNMYELEQILSCLQPKQIDYKKDECIVLAGNYMNSVGIVLEGKLTLQREDADGNANLVDEVHPGESFGEAFVCAGLKSWPISVWAAQKSTVLLLDYKRMLTLCPSACIFHSKLLENLLTELAQKLILLNQKMEIVQQITIQDKLMALFHTYATQYGSNSFTLPFARKELAEYLGVNRSAMSRDLGKMQQNGLVIIKGKEVTLQTERQKNK